MKVVIIGSGNTATVLGRKITAAGHQVLEVMSPNPQHAALLASELNCAYTSQWDRITTGGALYILAVPDRVLTGLRGEWQIDKQLVVHTAGSVPKDVLRAISKNYGVLYPLQSLHKTLPGTPEIPFLIDGNTPDDCAMIQDFALTLSSKVEVAGDEQRMQLHLAAVIINNFSNHLYTLAAKYCRRQGLDFNWLLPLASETVQRLKLTQPEMVQTGPAIRNDHTTIQKHLDLLREYPELNELYNYFSASISRHYAPAGE